MSFMRLGTIAPDVVDDILLLEEEKLATAALLLVNWAVADCKVDDTRLVVALAAVRNREPASDIMRANVRILVQELDERAWDIQDALNETDSQEEYDLAFCEARAVHTVLFALDEPSYDATLECAYEAFAAKADLPGLRRVIESARS